MLPPFLLGALCATAVVLGAQKLLAGQPPAPNTDMVQVAAGASSPLMPEPPSLPTLEAFKAYGNSTPAFSLAGSKLWGRLVDVYDGDTVKVVLPQGGTLYKFSVRMYGIDTAEMKSKIQANKEKAIRARNRLLEVATGVSPLPLLSTRKDVVKLLDERVTLVWVECLEFDKYGRLLAKLFNQPGDSRSFSQVLLDEKLAYEYFGDTKLTEAEQAELQK